MTLTARKVLADCEAARTDIIDAESGEVWRRRWIAALALLRAVGHVLDKVDTLTNGTLAEIIAERYALLKSTRPEPAIYWAFIDDERNVALKEYAIRAAFRASSSTGGTLTVADWKTGHITAVHSETAITIHLLTSGPFAGRRDVDVIAQAIAWWQTYLDDIDAIYSQRLTQPAT